MSKTTMSAMQAKRGIMVAVCIGILFVGLYVGAFLREREDLRNEMTKSLVRMALNLETADLVRQGKTDEAIALINSMNQINLVNLMRYDDLEKDNAEFDRRERKVLARLQKARDDYPAQVEKSKKDPEQEEYEKEVDDFLRLKKAN